MTGRSPEFYAPAFDPNLLNGLGSFVAAHAGLPSWETYDPKKFALFQAAEPDVPPEDGKLVATGIDNHKDALHLQEAAVGETRIWLLYPTLGA